MSVIAAIFLGFVQGVAEFLPISSSGHLAVLQNIFNMQTAENGHMFFDVLLHLGTVAAIIVAYWKDIKMICRDTVGFIQCQRYGTEVAPGGFPGARMLLMIFFGSLPLIIVLPFNDAIESLYYKTGFIGAAFLLTGCMLWVSDRLPSGHKTERSMTVKDALLIGLCQAVATIPGISRSGSTITGGLCMEMRRENAMKFSLLMSIPAVLAANLLSLIKALKNGVDWSCLPAYIIGTIVAMVVGYFSILFLRRLLHKGKFGKIAYYMWGVGAFALIASLFK